MRPTPGGSAQPRSSHPFGYHEARQQILRGTETSARASEGTNVSGDGSDPPEFSVAEEGAEYAARPMTERMETGGDARSTLERVLGIVTDVKAGEGITAVILTLNGFLLLTAYYVIKPVREGLILAIAGGDRYKSYLSAAIALSLLAVVPLYGRAADRFAKDKLVVGVTLFFASHLLVFYGLSKSPLESKLGFAFFVWVGIFNMMLVAQFWAFANDLYTEEQGKRLFALVGIGASAGSALGAYVAKLFAKTLGTYQLMLVSAGILAVSALTSISWYRAPGVVASRVARRPRGEGEEADQG
jgi:ATP:ADP antiporter, AAA family